MRITPVKHQGKAFLANSTSQSPGVERIRSFQEKEESLSERGKPERVLAEAAGA